MDGSTAGATGTRGCLQIQIEPSDLWQGHWIARTFVRLYSPSVFLSIERSLLVIFDLGTLIIKDAGGAAQVIFIGIFYETGGKWTGN